MQLHPLFLKPVVWRATKIICDRVYDHSTIGLLAYTISSIGYQEMILGPINKTELPRLTTPAGTIERVNTFKLLGVHIESSLSWLTHISNILKKVTRRLYFLKQLKRAGLPSSHLLYYCTSVIRPVLEYCVPV